jgi:riboflavin transporter FmnP
MSSNKKCYSTRDIARIGIFGAMATILYVVPFLKFPVPIFATFLEVNFSDLIALIGGFAFGPYVAAAIQLVKVLIKLPYSSTAMVGELADLILGIIYVVPAAIYYHTHKTKKGALVALLISGLIHLFSAAALNYLILTPFYVEFYFDGNSSSLIGYIQSTNANVTDLGWTYILWAIIPFNLFRNILISLVTFVVYKKTHRLINQIKFLR